MNLWSTTPDLFWPIPDRPKILRTQSLKSDAQALQKVAWRAVDVLIYTRIEPSSFSYVGSLPNAGKWTEGDGQAG